MNRYFLLREQDKIYFCETEIIDKVGNISVCAKRIASFDANLVSMLLTTGMMRLEENK